MREREGFLLQEDLVDLKQCDNERVGGFLDHAEERHGQNQDKMNESNQIADLLETQDANGFQTEADLARTENVLNAPTLEIHRHDLCVGELIPAEIGEQSQGCVMLLQPSYDEEIDIRINGVWLLTHEMHRMLAIGEVGDGNLLPGFHEDNLAIVF